MANDRTVDFTVRANTDATAQPMKEFADRVTKVTAALAEQIKASQSGATSAGDFGKALRQVDSVVQDLLRQKAQLASFGIKEDELAKALARLNQAKAARDALLTDLPGEAERDAKQNKLIQASNTAVAAAERSAAGRTVTYEKALAGLEKIGVTYANMAEYAQRLSAELGKALDAGNAGRVADESFLANRKRAVEYTEMLTAALKSREAVEREISEHTAAALASELAAREALRREINEATADRLAADLKAAEAAERAAQAARTQEAAEEAQAERRRARAAEAEAAEVERVRTQGRAAQARVDRGARENEYAALFDARDAEVAVAAAEAKAARERQRAEDEAFRTENRAARKADGDRLLAIERAIAAGEESIRQARRGQIIAAFQEDEQQRKADEEARLRGLARLAQDAAEAQRIRDTGRAAQARVDNAARAAEYEALFAQRDAEVAAAAAAEKVAQQAQAGSRAEQDKIDKRAALAVETDLAEAERIRATGRAALARIQHAAEEERIRALYDERDATLALTKAQEEEAAALAHIQALSRELSQAASRPLPQTAPLPQPTLADDIQARLQRDRGTPGFQGTALQGQEASVHALYVATLQVNGAMEAGGKTVAEYRRELQQLDAVERELTRQAGIVTAYEKQSKATQQALIELEAARAALRSGQAAADTALNSEAASEANHNIAGLARDFERREGMYQREAQALARETVVLRSLDVEVDEVGQAMLRLRQASEAASTARSNYAQRELADLKDVASQALVTAEAAKTRLMPGGVPTAPTEAPTATSRVASTLEGIQQPGRVVELDNADEALDRLEKRLKTGAVTNATYLKQMDQIYAIQRKLAEDAGLIDRFQAQVKATLDAERAFRAADTELQKLAKNARTGAASISDLQRAESGVASAAGNLERQLRTRQAISDQLRKQGIDERNLDAEIRRVTASAERLASVAARAGTDTQGTFLGLRGYQFKNFEYQLNDVITQLSLGQGLLRTFESQAGQILQIFDLSFASIVKWAIPVGAAAAVVGVLIASLSQVKERLDAIRGFDARQIVSADALQYTGRQLYLVQEQVRDYGASFEDAGEAVKHFAEVGLPLDRMAQFGRASQALVELYGKKMPEASKLLTDAFLGNFDGIKKLNEQFNFLTAAEYAAAKAAFEEGRAEEVRTSTFEKLSHVLEEAREKSLTPFDRAVRELKIAWREFLDTIASDSFLAEVTRDITEMVRSITSLINTIKELRGVVQPQTQGLELRRKVLEDEIKFRESKQLPGTTIDPKAQEALDALKKQLAEVMAQIDAAAGGGTLDRLQRELDELKAKRERMTNAAPPGQEEKDAREVASRPHTASAPGVPESYGRLRDEVADAVGLDREALARVQRIEGVFKDGAWANSPTGAKGPMQLIQSTFDEMKTAHKDITGDIHDLRSNTLAGAYYLRDRVQANNNQLAPGYSQYNTGPGIPASVSSDEARRAIARKIDGQSIENYTGSPLLNPSRSVLDSRIAALQVQIDAQKGARPAVPAPERSPVGVQAGTERSKTAQQQGEDILDKRRNEMQDISLKGDAAQEQIGRRVDEYAKTLRGELDKIPGYNAKNEENAKSIELTIFLYRKKLEAEQDKKDEADRQKKLGAEQRLADAANELRAKADRNDTTDIQRRLRAVDESYAKYPGMIRKAMDDGAETIEGKPLADFQKLIDAAKAVEKEQVVLKASTEIINKLLEERKAIYAKIEADLKSGAVTFIQAMERSRAAAAEFAPRLREGVGRVREAITQVGSANPSQALRTETAKLDAIKPEEPAFDDKLLKDGFDKLRNYIKTLDDARKTQKELLADGLTSRENADLALRAVYEATGKESSKLIDGLRQTVEGLNAVGALAPDVYQKYVAELRRAQEQTHYVSDFQKQLSKTIDDSITNHAVAGINTFTQSLGKLAVGQGKIKDVFSSLLQASADFTAGVLRDIAQMIIKYEVLAMVQSAMGKGGGGTGAGASSSGGGADAGSIFASLFKMGANYLSGGATGMFDSVAGSSFVGSSSTSSGYGTPAVGNLYHTGGIVGSEIMRRMNLDPAIFDNARRFHTGSMGVGLSANEVPTILEKGEEVLTRNDPRHIRNAGKGKNEATSQRNLRQVLVFDPKDISQAMAGSHGEDVMLTHIKNNASAINSMLGK